MTITRSKSGRLSHRISSGGWRAVVVLCAVALLGCSKHLDTLHYRLTVIVDTPEGRRSGSSVVEVQPILGAGFPGPEASGVTIKVKGEATPVKLSEGRYLFAVLKWETSVDAYLPMLQASYADVMPSGEPNFRSGNANQGKVDRISALAKAKGVRAVPEAHYPLLAYFEDLSDPRTIEPLKPDRLGQVVPGAKLVGMTVEITRAPVTRQIREILPWLEQNRSGYFDPDVAGHLADGLPPGRLLSYSHFILGG